MVHLTCVRLGMNRSFGLRVRGKVFNHRKQVRHQRFQDNIEPEEIVAKYSSENVEQYSNRGRTFKDARTSVGRKHYLLPNLSRHDLDSNEMFQNELDRQRALIARVDKITVLVDSVPGRGTKLIMNKDLSSPHDCAKHLHDLLTTRSIVAELLPYDKSDKELSTSSQDSGVKSDNATQPDSELTNSRDSIPKSIYWDMHRPLEESCRLKFRHFTEDDVGELNRIYWRSCSFVLGMALRLAFKDEIKVLPHSWPKPDIRSGSFIYDAALSLGSRWEPEEKELRAFTKVMWDIKNAALPFERLQVDTDTAKKLFSHNPFKIAQIDAIAEENRGKVTIYRCGGLLDISIGPMISNTNQIGRITLAAIHPFETGSTDYNGVFYRFQGVSLPQQLPISSYLYQNILINQAKRLNKTSL